MDHDAALAKIKKCLALSKSANANEAATALRQAQKLMEMHGLDEETVQLSDVCERSTDARMASIPAWEVSLARAVADAFGCEVLTQRRAVLGRGGLRRRAGFVFIGVGAKSEIAAYAMSVLSGQCARARLAHIAEQSSRCKPITKTARGDAFALAWVMSASRELKRFAGIERDAPLIAAYMGRHHSQLGTYKPKSRAVGRNVRDDSYVAGAAAGRQAKLNHAVGADAQPLLG